MRIQNFDPIPVGVIGVGHAGELHAVFYNQIADAKLVGVYDIDNKKGRQIAQELHTCYYADLRELLDVVKAVSVAVPTVSHFQVASEALKRGIHALIEKPIASTVEEADALIQLAQKKGAVLQVGHIERFNPAMMALKDLDLRPMFIEAHRLAPFNPRGTDVSVVLDLMIHDIDIILNLVKSPIKKVDASGVAVISDGEDIANARLQFENGCVANITASRISLKRMRKLRLFQENTYITIDFLQGISEIYTLEDEVQPAQGADPVLIWGEIGKGGKRKKILYRKPTVSEDNPLRAELQSFLKCIHSGRKPPVTGEDGRKALAVASVILDEIKKQRIINLKLKGEKDGASKIW